MNRAVITYLFPVAIMILCVTEMFGSASNISNAVITNNTNVSASKQAPIPRTMTLPELFDKVKDSVVAINVKVLKTNTHVNVSGTPLKNTEADYGSGYIYDSDGHVITNAHVVLGANTIDVKFLDGNSYLAAVVGSDPYSDLAVLKINDPSALFRESNMAPLYLANSSSIHVGQQVVAIGSPLGLTGTMSQGIISQIDRVKQDATTGRFWVAGLIQTDAIITHGNSGGPLLNLYGQVVGVTERGELSQEAPGLAAPGVSYAVPSKTIQNVVPQLIEHGTYKHPWLGIHIRDVDSDTAKMMNLQEPRGAIVVGITPGSPADGKINTGPKTISNNGISSNQDIVLAVDQNLVRGISDLINYIDGKAPGDYVTLKLFSSNQGIHDVQIRLAERPAPTNVTATA